MKIFLVRHGESLGNIDSSAYAEYGDADIPLTLWGEEQAKEAGKAIAKMAGEMPELQGRKFNIVHSTYQRAVETKNAIIDALGEDRIAGETPDFRLREQDMGVARQFMYDMPFDRALEKYRGQYELYEKACLNGGKFYAKPPLGESGEDVAARTGQAIAAIEREARHDDTPIIIVGHKAGNRTVEMKLLGKPPDWYGSAPKRNNCDVLMFDGDFENGFTVSCVHEGRKRPDSLPLRYKTKPSMQGREMI